MDYTCQYLQLILMSHTATQLSVNLYLFCANYLSFCKFFRFPKSSGYIWNYDELKEPFECLNVAFRHMLRYDGEPIAQLYEKV